MPENVFVLETDRPQRLRARWLFPVAGPPIENGVLEIQNGQITASHPQSDANTIDLGNVGLIPGLVNAHTHLEFSDLAQPIQPAKPFTSWIRALVAVRRSQPAEASAIQSGLQECWRTGATAIGEIATQDWSAANYHHSSVDCTVFREILGLRRERIAEQLEVARNWLAKSTDRDTKFVRGLSPHAPYSVHPELYQSLVELANEQRSPVAVHLAETRAELELLNQGTGEFVEMLQQFGAWDESAIPRGSRPFDYLLPLEKLTRALVIHGNYLSDDELGWLRNVRSVSVVYCPRTHAFFGHAAHPWLKMLDLGINVAIGTDSRGSNPDLSVWEELRFLRSHFPRVDPAQILQLGTLSGAMALGLDDQIGTLEAGKRATLAVIDFGESKATDPYELIFSGNGAAPLGFDNL